MTDGQTGQGCNLGTMEFCPFAAVDYCRSLRSENKELDREAAKIRAEIDGLTAQIK